MQLEHLFELIRKEDIVLWIGSGFSLYAGYPSGQQLASNIYDLLSTADKLEISPNLPLVEIAEQFVRINTNNRNLMNNKLQKIFQKSPIETRWHSVLSQIPHIKSIVTTNYDRLFEIVYKDQIQPIIFPEDVAKRDHRTELFKIHGDINHVETILITRSDYTDFFHQRKHENLIWSAIKERVSNKHILFIGYDLEDENVKMILRGISESIGENRKTMFLVAPNIKPSKAKYLSSLGITYFNYKGEVFVSKLQRNIKEQIFADFEKGYVSAETLRKFLKKNNLTIELKAFEDRFKVSSVRSTNNAKPEIAIKFKNEKRFLEPFRAILEGRKFGNLQIEGNELDHFKIILNQINVISDNLEDYMINLTAQPQQEGKVHLVFEDGTEFNDLKYTLYASRNLLEIAIQNRNSVLSTSIDGKEFQQEKENILGALNFEQKGPYENVNDAISTMSLCLNLAKGKSFIVYLDNQNNGTKLTLGSMPFPIDKLESNLEFYKSLKKIERDYCVRFTNFLEYTEDEFHNAFKAVHFSIGKTLIQQWDDELSFDLEKGASLELLLKIEKGAQFTAEDTSPETLQILGQKIELGYRVVEPLDLFITNREQVVKKTTTQVIVRSKSKQIRVYYRKHRNNE